MSAPETTLMERSAEATMFPIPRRDSMTSAIPFERGSSVVHPPNEYLSRSAETTGLRELAADQNDGRERLARKL